MQLGFEDLGGDIARVEATLPPAAARGGPKTQSRSIGPSMPAHLPREEKLTSEDWTGILVKAGTPANLVIRLNTAIGKALQTDKVHEALAKLGVDPASRAPEPSAP